MSKEAIIKAFEGVNVRIVWDDEKQEYFFSVNDIVEVLQRPNRHVPCHDTGMRAGVYR